MDTLLLHLHCFFSRNQLGYFALNLLMFFSGLLFFAMLNPLLLQQVTVFAFMFIKLQPSTIRLIRMGLV